MDILFFGFFWIRSIQNGSNSQIQWTDISNSRIQAQRAWFLVSDKSLTWFWTVCKKSRFSLFLYASKFFKDLIRTVIYIFLPIAVLYVQSFPKLPVWHAMPCHGWHFSHFTIHIWPQIFDYDVCLLCSLKASLIIK